MTHTREAQQQPIAPAIDQALAPLLKGAVPLPLHAWDGSSTAGTAGPDADGTPQIVLRSPDAIRRLLRHPGELGAAQAYVTGELDVVGDLGLALDIARREFARRGLTGVDLAALVRSAPQLVTVARHLGVLGLPPAPPASQARLRGRLHSRRRDQSAISHHYDLSNEFYEQILDPRMAYSCGWHTDGAQTSLEDAQTAKLDLVCRKVGLEPGQRFLDVGCGWGSLSLFAAEQYGAQVTGITIAREQKAFIDARIAERGLGDRVSIELRDYREETGMYDAVGSLEMGEHVGQRNYPTYVQTLRRCVKPGGHVLIQQMSRHDGHPGGGPFIEAFIAPDMTMRPVGQTVDLIEAGGLEVRGVQAMREHYVWTVDGWMARFEDNLDRIVELVGEEMARVFRLYLVGGAQAFRDGRMGVDQILARRPVSDSVAG